MKTLHRAFAWSIIIAMIMGMGDFCALASVLTMPQALSYIDIEAFYGDTSLDEVVLNDGVTAIGSRAFANSSLKEINLPDSLTYIANSAFSGLPKVTATAPKGSYAYNWALDHDNMALTGSCGTNCTWTLWQGTLTITLANKARQII